MVHVDQVFQLVQVGQLVQVVQEIQVIYVFRLVGMFRIFGWFRFWKTRNRNKILLRHRECDNFDLLPVN